MTLKDQILLELKDIKPQEDITKEIQKTVKNMIKTQLAKKAPVIAFEAEIYSKYGGNAMKVYSFAKNASEAIKEIQGRADFKQFAKRPYKVTLNL